MSVFVESNLKVFCSSVHLACTRPKSSEQSAPEGEEAEGKDGSEYDKGDRKLTEKTDALSTDSFDSSRPSSSGSENEATKSPISRTPSPKPRRSRDFDATLARSRERRQSRDRRKGFSRSNPGGSSIPAPVKHLSTASVFMDLPTPQSSFPLPIRLVEDSSNVRGSRRGNAQAKIREKMYGPADSPEYISALGLLFNRKRDGRGGGGAAPRRPIPSLYNSGRVSPQPNIMYKAITDPVAYAQYLKRLRHASAGGAVLANDSPLYKPPPTGQNSLRPVPIEKPSAPLGFCEMYSAPSVRLAELSNTGSERKETMRVHVPRVELPLNEPPSIAVKQTLAKRLGVRGQSCKPVGTIYGKINTLNLQKHDSDRYELKRTRSDLGGLEKR